MPESTQLSSATTDNATHSGSVTASPSAVDQPRGEATQPGKKHFNLFKNTGIPPTSTSHRSSGSKNPYRD